MLRLTAYTKNVVSSYCPLIKHHLDWVDVLLGLILSDQDLITCQHLIQILAWSDAAHIGIWSALWDWLSIHIHESKIILKYSYVYLYQNIDFDIGILLIVLK
jgi:hypothetical protein